MIEQAIGRLWVLAPVGFVSFLVSLQLIVLLRPWLARHALAHPNARSSHHAPTPQGGGIAVIAATVAVTWGAVALAPALAADHRVQLLAMTAAVILLAVVGGIDDLQSLPATPRLAMQCVAVGAIIAALPADWHILPHLPWWVERGCLFFGGLWFVNLVNFMDGIDWMTVAEVVPTVGAIALFGLIGQVEMLPALLAAALLGAILGFAPFNKPVARLFLGDVGSLPIGLLLGWLLLQLAGKRPSGGSAHPAALLSGRCDHHARPASRRQRADLAGASQPFLSARDRPGASPFPPSSGACSWSTLRWSRSRFQPLSHQVLPHQGLPRQVLPRWRSWRRLLW